MSLDFSSLLCRFEMLPGPGGRGSGNRVSISDVQHAKRILKPMLDQDKDLRRLRGFLAWSLGWRGLEKRRNIQVLELAAEALFRGSLLLESTPIGIRASIPKPKRPEAAPEIEAWVEAAPEPEPVRVETESFAVSFESASALAESNRGLAASGSPFKEICAIQDCPVCNAQLAVMAG